MQLARQKRHHHQTIFERGWFGGLVGVLRRQQQQQPRGGERAFLEGGGCNSHVCSGRGVERGVEDVKNFGIQRSGLCWHRAQDLESPRRGGKALQRCAILSAEILEIGSHGCDRDRVENENIHPPEFDLEIQILLHVEQTR